MEMYDNRKSYKYCTEKYDKRKIIKETQKLISLTSKARHFRDQIRI